MRRYKQQSDVRIKILYETFEPKNEGVLISFNSFISLFFPRLYFHKFNLKYPRLLTVAFRLRSVHNQQPTQLSFSLHHYHAQQKIIK